MFYTGELVGDVDGKLYSKTVLGWALLLVISSYFLILQPLFNTLAKIKIKPLYFPGDDEVTGRRLGYVLFISQLVYLAFNLFYGVNVAGNSPTDDNIPFSFFWALFPVDTLVVIYYGNYRSSKMFYPNLFIWIIGNLIRGWSGVLFLVMFFEWCRAYRGGKISMRIILILAIFCVIFYPLLLNLKWIVRASAQSNVGLFELINTGISGFDASDYFSLIGDGILQVVSRFQTTSNLVEVIRLRELLQSEFLRGSFTPFWMEGLHGIVFERLFYSARSIPIGVAFTGYGDFNYIFDIGSWNTNIAFAGWFFIAPFLIPIYIAYTIFLGFLSFFLTRKISSLKQSEDMLWFMWLIYILPPWHSAFILFIYSLILFVVLKGIVSWVGFSLVPRVPVRAEESF